MERVKLDKLSFSVLFGEGYFQIEIGVLYFCLQLIIHSLHFPPRLAFNAGRWSVSYIANKNNNMEKFPLQEDTKNTEMSFPIILSSLKQRESESEKTLFKNGSVSSDQGMQTPTLPKKMNNPSNLPELDQIKKFLKRGEQINNETLRKLKEDKQINELVKQDRSSASLYKTSRHLDFISVDNPKEKEIKRIYMSHKKTKSKPLFIFPIYRGKKASQEVQTDTLQPQLMIGSRNNLAIQPTGKYPSFQHHISYNTIQAIQEEFSSKQQRRPQHYTYIEEDNDEDRLPPNRQRKNVTVRAKAMSSKIDIDGYMRTMGKTSFDFYNGMNKINNRYKQYKQQETIYSKTIDMKPLLPLKETLNTFIQSQVKLIQNTTKSKKVEEQNVKIASEEPPLPKLRQKEKTTENRLQDSALVKIQKVQSKIEQMQRKIEGFKQYLNPQPVIPFTLDKQEKQRQFEHHSSMVAEQSQNISPFPTSRSRDATSRVTENLISLMPASPLQRKRQNKLGSKDKTSILVQVPSMHELKVGNVQTATNQIHHPIRQHFNQNQMSWVKNQYHPKHQLFKGVNLLDFQIKKYKNGVFFGEIDEEGHKHGKGIIFYYSGKIYEGEMDKDMKHGKGLEIYPDGSRFKGEFIAGLKQGRGVFQWSNGEIYDGQWQSGRKSGSGMWKGTDGESYIGEWKNGKVQGFGVYIMKNGSRYQGQFKNSLKHGVGTERFYNGETYVGNYEKNRPNGEGEYYWANGDYYKGEFSNGLRHGEGYFKEHKTGIEYRGQYRNDKKCGYGEINYENGVVYVGNFENNFRHGFGELTENGEMKYRGYWINDHQVQETQLETVPAVTKKQESRTKKKEIRPIPPIHIIKQDELERQESLPKPIVQRNQAQPKQERQPTHSHHHHNHNPQQGEQGYKRPCGCNKKH